MPGITGAIGTSLLGLATCLLIVSCISAPAIKPLGFLHIEAPFKYSNVKQSLVFGVFGACHRAADGSSNWSCTSPKIGYNVAELLAYYDTPDNAAMTKALKTVSTGLLMHPIAAIFSLLGFVIGCFSNKFGFIVVNIASFLAFLSASIAVIVDFAIFTGIWNVVKKMNLQGQQLRAGWGPACWVTLLAGVALLIAQLFTLFQCCCGRTRKQRENDAFAKAHKGNHYIPVGTYHPPAASY